MIQAVIFDMNGVLINDEWFHNQSWEIFCKKHGFNLLKEEFNKQAMGKRDAETLNYLFQKTLTETEVETYANERDKIVQEIIKDKLMLTDGLQKLLDTLSHNNIPLALATSSRKPYVDFILDKFAIRNYFKIILTAEDVERGKPDPEVYLKSAKLLGTDPKDCIVFEDTISGIKAVKAAGMKCIAITTTYTKDKLKEADSIIDSFKEINISEIQKI